MQIAVAGCRFYQQFAIRQFSPDELAFLDDIKLGNLALPANQDLIQAGEVAFAGDALSGLTGDEATGANIVRVAIDSPLKQIAANAGLEPGVVAEKVRNLPSGQQRITFRSAGRIFNPLIDLKSVKLVPVKE